MNRNDVQTTSSTCIDFDDVSITVEGTPVSDAHYFRNGKEVFVAYLEHDGDCENPLGAGLGSIYSAHRNSRTKAEMQSALGLDSEWNADVSNEAVLRISSEKFATRLFADQGFGDVVLKHLEVSTLDELKREMWATYFDPYRSPRRHFHQDFADAPEQYPIDLFDHSAWLTARSEGKVGNPFFVLLNVYEHSGTVYSVTGEGMNCTFDTAKCVAVWVPGEHLERNLWRLALATFKVTIDEKAAVHEWQPSENGRDYGNGVKQELVKISDAVYTVVLDGSLMSHHSTFDDAREAAIRGLGRRYDGVHAIQAAREQALTYARTACEAYSAWVNGDCFATVVETWKVTQDEDGDYFPKLVNSETGSGFIGRTDADEALEAALEVCLAAN